MIRFSHQILKPNIVVGYTRNERFIKALDDALSPQDFKVSLAGSSIYGKGGSIFAYQYQRSVIEWLAENISSLEGVSSIPLSDDDYPPYAIIYPQRLRGKFIAEEKLPIVSQLIKSTQQLENMHPNTKHSITLYFTTVHSSIDQIIQSS